MHYMGSEFVVTSLWYLLGGDPSFPLQISVTDRRGKHWHSQYSISIQVGSNISACVNGTSDPVKRAHTRNEDT